ncbi:uncharacterized protein LOC131158354 isoform X2 [Malania oleifera]|uniref:uncharacterized protein LOC131158354 isoform X2 n=1 Tax=Malania oleifera TaxID=397392 RepID=UPI0025AE18C7|nr:uncharacterized protein LOC131158354 isoform X2 [Malania oleifera]
MLAAAITESGALLKKAKKRKRRLVAAITKSDLQCPHLHAVSYREAELRPMRDSHIAEVTATSQKLTSNFAISMDNYFNSITLLSFNAIHAGREILY